MRRLAAVITAGLVFLTSVAPVAAVKPDRGPAVWEPLALPAGTVCEFDVTVEVSDHNQRMTTFFDRFGNPRTTAVTGHGPLLATNEETGAQILIEGGGRQTFGGDADTFILTGSGVTGLYFFPGDATPVGVGDGGLYVVKGSFYEELDLNTNVVTVLEIRGTVIDVCAALASD